MSFVDGDLWERSFETANGVVDVLAEVVLDGRRVELRTWRSTRVRSLG